MIALFFLFLTLSVSPFKSKRRLEAENAALRHQLMVLQRRVRGRVQLTNGDRLFLVLLYRWFPSVLKAITIKPIIVVLLRVDEVLRTDSRLGTCVAIVQCAVSVGASSSTGASSGTAAAVVSSHSIGSGLRVIARASTSSMRETGTMSRPFLMLSLISTRSLAFSSGMSTVLMPPRKAASSFSLRPAIGHTRPRSVISPVMASHSRYSSVACPATVI